MRVVLLLALFACVHPVAVRSDPAGAYVSMDGVRVGVTPYTIEVKRRQSVTVEMVGYRPLSFWVGPATPPAVEVRLIPEHGGAGTWEPTEAR